MTQFTVVYRRGGVFQFSWHRTLAVPTREEAVAILRAIERAGRAGFIAEHAIGAEPALPTTYEHVWEAGFPEFNAAGEFLQCLSRGGRPVYVPRRTF